MGSNVFNIFLGIGLPMFFTELLWGTPFIVTDAPEVAMAGIMLVAIAIIQTFILQCAKWVLSPKLAGFLMIFFILYIFLSILFEADRSLAYDAMDAFFNVEGYGPGTTS